MTRLIAGISVVDETYANNKTIRCASARPAGSRWSPQFLPAAMSRLRVALRCTLPTRLCRKGRGVLDLHKQRRTNNQPAAMSSAASPGSDDDHVPSLSGTVVVSASAYECGDSTAAVGKASPHPMMPIRPREDLVFPGLPGAFSPAGHEVTPSSSGIGSEFALPMSSNTVAGPVDVTPEVNGISGATASKPNPNTRRAIVACVNRTPRVCWAPKVPSRFTLVPTQASVLSMRLMPTTRLFVALLPTRHGHWGLIRQTY